VRRCLRDPLFCRFGTILMCVCVCVRERVRERERERERETDGQANDDSIYRASIASRVKNRFQITECKCGNVSKMALKIETLLLQ